MNATFRNLSALAIAFGVSITISSVYAQEKGKGKAKGKQDDETKGKHGRAAGDIPFDLEQFCEKNEQLPSGLQKRKDTEGLLTRGLEEDGKRLTSTGKGKKRTP
jgi:hypothetical protein